MIEIRVRGLMIKGVLNILIPQESPAAGQFPQLRENCPFL
jgi:hypothetical protein